MSCSMHVNSEGYMHGCHACYMNATCIIHASIQNPTMKIDTRPLEMKLYAIVRSSLVSQSISACMTVVHAIYIGVPKYLVVVYNTLM